MLPRRAEEQRLSDSCRHESSGGIDRAADCVEHTERMQLQWHCDGVDENSAALEDENARAWTKTRGNSDSCIDG